MVHDKYEPDFIVGISRGGLIPAVMLSHLFNVPMVPVVWATRDFVEEDHERVTQVRDLVLGDEKDVLIVDDICDTGHTFETFQECLMQDQISGYAPGVEFASLHIRYSAEFAPRYYAVEIPDESWIIYPYEREPQNHAIDNLPK